MRRLALTACVLLLAFQTKAAYCEEHLINVSRHSSVSYSDSLVDDALTKASKILKDDDDKTGSDDVGCDVTLKRSGSIALFTTSAPSTISSKETWDEVSAEPTFAKIVAAITYCGKSGAFAGCASKGGRSMAVVSKLNYPGQVWAHEFGHTTNLPHRTGNKAIMSGDPLTSANTYLNSAECNSFKSGPPSSFVAAIAIPSPGLNWDANSIDALIRSDFVDTIPYAQISAFGPENSASIIAMLSNPAESDHWPNALTVLGIIGDRSAVADILSFLRQDQIGVDEVTIYRSKLSAQLALAYLANRHEDREAFTALVDYTQPGPWNDVRLWSALDPALRAERINSMRENAISALALSGFREVDVIFGNALVALRSQNADQKLIDRMQDLQRLYLGVRLDGLERYYSN